MYLAIWFSTLKLVLVKLTYTFVCLFVTYMAKKMDLDYLSCLRPRMKILRSEN